MSYRTKHYISALRTCDWEEVEAAILKAAEEDHVHITEFTVAPMIAQHEGKSYYEWFIEFENRASRLIWQFTAHKIDNNLRQKMCITTTW